MRGGEEEGNEGDVIVIPLLLHVDCRKWIFHEDYMKRTQTRRIYYRLTNLGRIEPPSHQPTYTQEDKLFI